MSDTADMLPPGIDPETRKLGVRTVKAFNDGGTRTECYVREFPMVATDEPDSLGGTNTAPSPLETALVSLVGCDGAILHGVAKAMRFDYAGVAFECASQIDLRGPKGVKGVRPYFEKVKMTITVYTDEPQARLQQLQRNVELRCPVMNLFRAADVEMDVEWLSRPKDDAPADSSAL